MAFFLPMILIDGAQTSTAFFRSSLRTQWYRNDVQCLASAANEEQFFFLTASLYDDTFVGHSDTT